MEIPQSLLPFLNRPAAVFGGGVSGRAASTLLRSLGIFHAVLDEANGDVFTVAQAERLGLVVYSPGFRRDHPWMLAAKQGGCFCLTEIDFAAAFWPGALVAVTGTNGKTTTTELLAAAFQATGTEAIAAGNIGHPLSQVATLPRSKARLAVCELSSFQAEDLAYFKPSALLWTNFTQDHLDRYESMEAYFSAKWELVKNLTRPRLFVGPTVESAAKEYGYELPSYTQVIDLKEEVEVALQETIFAKDPQKENYLLAHAYWKAEGLPMEALIQGAFNMPTSPHRLREIRRVNGIAFWNDSKATNFASALAALKTFDRPVLWIGGGYSKGGDESFFADMIAPHIKAAFVMGDTAKNLQEDLARKGKKAFIVNEMDAAVQAAFELAEAGDIVLLSPGFASFGLFENYAERGNFFIEAVLGLNSSAKSTKTMSESF